MPDSVSISLTMNKSSISKKVGKAIDSSRARDAALAKVRPIYQRAVRRFHEDFENSNVTQEIEAGPTAENISLTLNGYGNLFSFIGFNDDEDPLSALRDVLQDGFELIPTRRIGTSWYLRVNMPSKNNIIDATPMPWESGSWAFGIEEGISGLGHYMYKHWEGGRSKEGFQLPYENLEDEEFKPVGYISELLKRFQERMEGIS